MAKSTKRSISFGQVIRDDQEAGVKSATAISARAGLRRTGGVIKTASGVEEAAYIHKEEAGTIGHR